MILKDKEIDINQPIIFLPYHSFRKDLISEFNECANLRRDSKIRIYEQLNDYLEINSEYMKNKPYWAGLILRNHNHKKLIEFSEIWFANVCRYSKRDQLSLIHSSYQANIKLRGFALENSASKYHKWPVKKNITQGKQKDELLIDFVTHKYIKNLSKKINYSKKLFINIEERKNILKIIFSKNFFKRLIKKFKTLF